MVSLAGVGALLLADARLPTGGHTQSGGLEPALLGGMSEAAIAEYLLTRLRSTTLVDAATAVVTLMTPRWSSAAPPRGTNAAHPRWSSAADEGGGVSRPHDDAPGSRYDPSLRSQSLDQRVEPWFVDEVVDAWAARTPSDVVRAASYEAGRGYLRVLQRISGATVLEAAPRPVAMGLLARHLAITPTDLARVVCHDDVQTICAAALKLAPGDPLDTVQWALSVAPEVEAIVAQVASPPLSEPNEIPAAAAPLSELWQHQHATAPRRLFRA